MAIDTLSINPYINSALLESKLKNEADSSSRKGFGRILTETIGAADIEKTGASRDKAGQVAEIVKLEMMRSSLSFGENDSESMSGGIENKIKLILQYYDEYRHESAAAQDVPSSPESVDVKDQPQVVGGLDSIINKASRTYGVDPGLIKAVIKAESNFNPHAVSSAGAQGLMQLMPSTASGMGVRNSFDPEQNVMAGTKFLKQMLDRYDGNLNSALAAYNWGPGNLERKGGSLPRETREYMAKVKKYFAEYST